MSPRKPTTSSARRTRNAYLLAKIYSVESSKSLSAMLVAAACDGDIQKIKAMLEAGAAIDKAKDARGNLPLHVAAKYGQAAMVKFLLAHGANPSSAKHETTGSTPMHLAAEWGHAEVVKLLLSAGANAFLANRWGESPRDIARQNGYREIERLLKRTEARAERLGEVAP